MEFITVNAVADSKEVKIIKGIIDTLSEKLPYMIVTPFKFGKLGDNTIVTFKIEKSCHQVLLEKLTYNNIKVLTFDENSKKYVEEAQNYSKGSSLSKPGSRSGQKSEEKKPLDDIIKEGEYQELIKISRDITLPKDVIDKAKSNIDNCIMRAINNAYNEGLTKKFEIYKNVEKLIKIASDNTLKIMQKMEYIKLAGLNAVEICAQNKDYVGDLINICNNNALHAIVNIKAAVKFGELILSDRDTYKKEIYIAKRNLNTRWLTIAFSSVEMDLSEAEKSTFNNMIDFIKNGK